MGEIAGPDPGFGMDEQELRRGLEAHHEASFGWALACCRGNREEAEDVLQAAYLKVLSGKARFGNRSAFRTWLFSVIRLTAADLRRRHAVRRVLLDRWGSDPAVGPGSDAGAPGAAAGLDTERLGERLRRAIVTLPRRQQEVLQLVFYHDQSLSEAAAVMGVSLGSARTHYHRGKERLRGVLREDGIDV